MLIFPVTALYAALLTAIGLVLLFQVVAVRRRTGISILHGTDMEVAETIRRHGNLIENVPMALILMGLVEANGGSEALLHSMGILLVLARIAHPLGLRHDQGIHMLRIAGVAATVLPMAILGGVALWQALGAFQ